MVYKVVKTSYPGIDPAYEVREGLAIDTMHKTHASAQKRADFVNKRNKSLSNY